MSYLMKATGKGRSTPQNQPIPGSKQVRNNAGGYGWEVDDLVRLRRFICLGCEKGTYYATEEKLAAENCTAIASLIAAERGPEVVKEILDYSLNGRTAKQDPIIFALAMCARSSDPETKRLAYDAVGKVCRIPTFLFSFVQFVEAMDASTSGWGRGMRRAISSWYNDKDPRELAFAVTKYRQRNGWSHTDLLRLAHAKPKAEGHQLVFRYVTKGPEALPAFEEEGRKDEEEFDLCDQPLEAARAARRAHELLAVVEEVAKLEDLDVLCDRIRRFRLAREHIPTQHLNSLPVWRTLLEEMPLTAMIRNLAKMTTIGLLTEGSEHAAKVAEKLGNLEQLRRARVHPFNVLVALKIYSAGRGEKGKLTWTPVKQVVAALDRAFDLSFKCVEPTGQDVVIGLDVSGSMCCPVLGSESITCREASMAMAMVTARTEKNCKMMAFTGRFVPLHGVKPGNSLEDNLRAINGLPFGSTDCALPMVWALENRVRAETFIIYTDNDTWVGKIHPSEALVKYRREMNVPHAKLIVVAMSPSKFSIADPNDRGMLDIAGFDANAPEVMRNFMLGLL